MLQALCGVLLRSIRVSQTNSVIAGVSQIMELIRHVLETEVDLAAMTLDSGLGEEEEEGGGGGGWVFSSKMKLEALKRCSYDVGEAANVLRTFLADLEELREKMGELESCRHILTSGRRELGYMIFHMTDFNLKRAVQLLKGWFWLGVWFCCRDCL